MRERNELETVEGERAERCETCKYWECKVEVPFSSAKPYRKWDTVAEYEQSTNDPGGDCRRYPKYHEHYSYDWCGEYQPTIKPPSPTPNPPVRKTDPPELTASPLYLLSVLHSARTSNDAALEAVTRKKLADLGVKIIFGNEQPTTQRRNGRKPD